MAMMVYDEVTNEQLTYPYISARSLRVELGPAEYVWIGNDDVKYFANAENLGKWVAQQVEKIVEEAGDRERDY